MQISETPKTYWPNLALLNLGFRPFFLGASLFGAFSIAIWLIHYTGKLSLYPTTLPATLWHAHEMVFGYITAVIAGFLLTASKNWTNRQTLHQLPLALMVVCWALPRILLLCHGTPLWLTALLDVAFNCWLFIAVSIPIISTSAKKQYPILGKIIFLILCNGLFYSQALGFTVDTASIALYLALFVVLGLILMMSRRLIPFFIERGIGEPVAIKNNKIIDIASLVFFVAFLIFEFFTQQIVASSICAGVLALVLGIRAYWWHHPGIWRKPLLWSLYLAYCTLVIGFCCYAFTPLGLVSTLLALHILTIGGIGLITVAMMARVSLGHTGRDIHSPPPVIYLVFVGILLSLLIRVVGALVFTEHYIATVLISGSLWIAAMLIFTLRYLPILCKKRIDNNYG